MTTKRYDPEIHRRRTIRLKGHDYSSAGAYFVTVCTQEHEHLFGEITDSIMHLNDTGRIVETVWAGLPERFPMVTLDEFVVMPNHFHGIIVIIDDAGNRTVGALLAAPPLAMPPLAAPPAIPRKQGTVEAKDATKSVIKKGAAGSVENQGAASSARTVGQIMRAFKSISAINVNRVLGRSGQPLWQRNYFERIIRNEKELENIQEYIVNNPARWEDDPENQMPGTEYRP